MSNISLQQSIFTIAIAIIIYLVKSLLDEFLFEPKKEYNKIRGKIATALMFYANQYSNPTVVVTLNTEEKREVKDARKELRKLASDLYGFSENISCFTPRAACLIPTKPDLNIAIKNLIGLSNGLTRSLYEQNAVEFNHKKTEEIEKSLKIHPID